MRLCRVCEREHFINGELELAVGVQLEHGFRGGAKDAKGDAWRTPVTVDEAEWHPEAGAFSLEEVNGHPAIGYGYSDPSFSQLRYAVYY